MTPVAQRPDATPSGSLLFLASALGGHLRVLTPLRCVAGLAVDVSVSLTQKEPEC